MGESSPQARAAASAADRIRYQRDALLQQQHEVEQILGRALNFAPYPPEFPGLAGEVNIGEHTIVTLAQEAARQIDGN